MTIDRAKDLADAARQFIAKVERGEARSVRSYGAFKAALLVYETANPWRDANKELPPKNTLVEVCGHSGMSRHQHFLTYALHMPEYRPLEPWRDIQQNALMDWGWIPLFWRFPEPLPDLPKY